MTGGFSIRSQVGSMEPHVVPVLMRRKVIRELFDDDCGTGPQIATALRDLRRVNDWFGGTRTTLKLLRRVASESGLPRLSVLEVGSGAGDVPLTAKRRLAGEGIDLGVTLLDLQWSHLPANGTAAVSGDALQLPFREGTFDVISSSLFAHHFEPDEFLRFCCETLRVSRRAVLINDLIRSPLHLALAYAGLPLLRSHMTRHDARASVRRSYTRDEMRQMLAGLPVRRIDLTRHYLYRMGVLLWK